MELANLNESLRSKLSVGNQSHSSMQFLDDAIRFFHTDIGGHTAACIYGSAATGDWVAARSDIDLFVFVHEDKLPMLGQQIAKWRSNPFNPALDGYAIFASPGGVLAKRIDAFELPAVAVDRAVELIDLWNIKNRSQYLFGNFDLKSCVRNIEQQELKRWAIDHLSRVWAPIATKSILNTSFEHTSVPLSTVIWTASGLARVLMLIEGANCSSKRAAIHWLGSKCPEIRDTMNLLDARFEEPDSAATAFTTRETENLCRVYLQLIQEALQQPASPRRP